MEWDQWEEEEEEEGVEGDTCNKEEEGEEEVINLIIDHINKSVVKFMFTKLLNSSLYLKFKCKLSILIGYLE